MRKVGPIVTVPTGSLCYVTLDSGEKVVVHHEHQGARGASAGARLTIDRLKRLGFSSETVVQIELDGDLGKAALSTMASAGGLVTPASPLRVLVAFVQTCVSVADVVARCQRMVQHRTASEE